MILSILIFNVNANTTNSEEYKYVAKINKQLTEKLMEFEKGNIDSNSFVEIL
ncbi:MAG: hypothetical protein V1921_03320 [Candidatus Altiarchaeota archaeon]